MILYLLTLDAIYETLVGWDQVQHQTYFAETSDAGQCDADSEITWSSKTNPMLDEVEFKKCFIEPKHSVDSK